MMDGRVGVYMNEGIKGSWMFERGDLGVSGLALVSEVYCLRWEKLIVLIRAIRSSQTIFSEPLIGAYSALLSVPGLCHRSSD